MASNGERSHLTYLTNQISCHGVMARGREEVSQHPPWRSTDGTCQTQTSLRRPFIRMCKRRRQLRQGDRSHGMDATMERTEMASHHGHQSILSATTTAPAAGSGETTTLLASESQSIQTDREKGCAGGRRERREFAVAAPSGEAPTYRSNHMISTLDMRMYKNHPLRRKISPTAAAARPPEQEEVKKEGAHSRRQRDRPSEHPSLPRRCLPNRQASPWPPAAAGFRPQRTRTWTTTRTEVTKRCGRAWLVAS